MRPRPKYLFKDHLEDAETEFFYRVIPDGWWNGDRVLLESDRKEHLLKGDEADIEKISRKLDALNVDYETSSGGIEDRRDPGEMEMAWEELHIPRDKFRRNKVVVRLAREMEADVYDPDKKLRASLQKLAKAQPELRKHLAPLLARSKRGSTPAFVMQGILVLSGADTYAPTLAAHWLSGPLYDGFLADSAAKWMGVAFAIHKKRMTQFTGLLFQSTRGKPELWAGAVAKTYVDGPTRLKILDGVRVDSNLIFRLKLENPDSDRIRESSKALAKFSDLKFREVR